MKDIKTLYIQCDMGAAGDMLTAALLELIENPEQFVNQMNKIGLPSTIFGYKRVTKYGVSGTEMSVCIGGIEEDDITMENNSPVDAAMVIKKLIVSDRVKQDAIAVFAILAEAENAVHKKRLNNIHCHTFGTLDAIADIVSFCKLMELLNPEEVLVTPIHVGSGIIRCRNGVLPVPAPATAYILRGIPNYSGLVLGELCTPTGAALLKYFAHKFVRVSELTTVRVGLGMGKRDIGQASVVRAYVLQ